MTALAADSTVGVLRVGPARVAVTRGVLREVLPCPEQLEPFPAAGAGLLGAVNLRGSVVPVLDLRLLLGWPPERTAEQIVAVLNLEGRIIGLLCDEVLGVTDLTGAALQQLADAEDDLLFSHSFERPEDGRIVSLLDVDRLLRLPGVPATSAPTTEGAPPPAADERSGGVTELVVFRCGDIRLGLDVARVHALLPKVDLTPSPLVGRLCVGVTEYGGRSVPAVPLLRLVGLEDGRDTGLSGGLILRYPESDGYVALLLTEVIEIVQVRDDELLELPGVLSSISAWFHGLVALPGIGDVLVIDSARLHSERELATLAQFNTTTSEGAAVPSPRASSEERASSDERSSSDERTAPTGARYLTYAAGREAATPLLQVSEIITYPEVWTPIQREESALLGVFTHRGAVVPLIRLASLLGVADDSDAREARVVVVRVPSGTVGFIVPTLRAIEESTWEEAAPSGQWSFAGATEEAAASRVIRVGAERTDRNLRTVDLAAIAAALTSTPAPVT
jgi:purine-binding chemotaxis protein CheW